MMIKKWVPALIALLLMVPTTAFAADGSDLKIDGADRITSTESPTLKAEGGTGGTGYKWYRGNDKLEMEEEDSETGEKLPTNSITTNRSGDYYVVQDGKRSETVRIAREFETGGSSPLAIGRRSNTLATRKDSEIEKLEARVEQVAADSEKPLPNVTLKSVYSGVERAASSGGVVTLYDAGLLESNVQSVLMRLIGESNLPDRVFADTVTDQNVVTRLSLIPSIASSPVDLRLTLADQELTDKIEGSFSNDLLVLDAAQQGTYGQMVEMMVKTSSLSESGNLCFYRYDVGTNLCSPISVSKVSVDAMGYLHFSVNSGGIIVISQGDLTK